ncbi:uncharacterized protein LOC121732704 [Aricia agestis]|uniref:uncharacterized protein LOC121732704 n=1 Tax=Aricia agestis TaxID=91739 RepID=UPI001C20700B|nr:uncharacterized protein LOC121732704 [Aricia agestis]
MNDDADQKDQSVENGEHENGGFDPSPEVVSNEKKMSLAPSVKGEDEKPVNERPQWDNQYEFLMSCIATSVGLGNVWRFPFVAYQNGGGAFLIPYIIVLVVIGKPMYFLETVIGQFSNSNCVKVWDMSPAMRGTGYAQTLGAAYVLSYYMSIIGLCMYYFAMSFSGTLPWAVCQPDWPNCVPSGASVNMTAIEGEPTSSAEYYFTRTVLRQSDGIHDGIGTPIWDLTLCLLASWAVIWLIVARGVKSSGKAAWFLAIFPYCVLIILLIRAVTLPGAVNGIIFFINPEWSKILELQVWYAAVTQVFFSLSVCSGALIMFSSYNGFTQNVYRDSMIVTTLDTFTSLISGITIFGVLGNLAYELNYDDVSDVIKGGGTSLAFISYPDAIAKSPFAPQLFAVLFFLMMAVLGIGSGVALLSTVNTLLLDAFPKVPTIVMSSIVCVCGFLVGLIYVTPGGQYVLEIVDHYGGSFMRLFASIAETMGVCWIYGVENLCLDIEYMLGIKISAFWRVCWAIVTPVLMCTVFFYSMITAERIVFGEDYEYPWGAYLAGDLLQYAGMAMVPLFIIIGLWIYRSKNVVETFKNAFRKRPTYGPTDPERFRDWKNFKQQKKEEREAKRKNLLHHYCVILFKGYSRMADMSCRKRPRWDNKYEFWVSIISATVGFGNVWRFPFIAFQNGGGAFLIPYVIILVLIGSPLYFLETSVGQFSNRNCVNVWEMSPAMKGTGYAQTLGAAYNLTYNVSLIALCLYYIAMSFSNPLPWSVCDPEWTDCIPSGTSVNMSEVEGDLVSSAEYFFRRTVLRQSDGIHDGIGTPLWDLSLCLLAGWIIIFVVVSRGIKSSGKAAWFFALFPYVGLTVLLIRAVTLPGAEDGILFLITPQWHRMLEFGVWYQAATQIFFSLSVSSGILIMYSSYNNYNNNVYKVSLLVSYLDSVTSLVAAIIVFAVLGNLAHELNYDDITKVIKGGGTSLAFISYPDAIAKSPFAPQLFAVLFFLMLVSLGLGCGVAMMSTVNTMLLDKFPRVPFTLMSIGVCVCGFSVGLVYMTPGGQYILEIVDFYGGPFMRVFTSIPETIGFCWIYGIENICLDIEFMLKRKTSSYWRVCWAVVTPIFMFVIFTYAMVTSDRIKFGGTYEYPWEAYFAGEMLRYIGISLVPLFMLIGLWRNRSTNVIQMIKDSFRKAPTYGPLEKKDFHEWKEFRQSAKVQRAGQRRNWLHHIGVVLFKGYKTD